MYKIADLTLFMIKNCNFYSTLMVDQTMYLTLLEIYINRLIKQIFTFKLRYKTDRKQASGAENAPK